MLSNRIIAIVKESTHCKANSAPSKPHKIILFDIFFEDLQHIELIIIELYVRLKIKQKHNFEFKVGNGTWLSIAE